MLIDMIFNYYNNLCFHDTKKKNLLLVYDRRDSGSQVKTNKEILIRIILFVIEIQCTRSEIIAKKY